MTVPVPVLEEADLKRKVSRRNFFRVMLAALVILVLINAFRLGFVSYPGPDVSLEYLTDKEYAILKAAADTLLPGTAKAPPASALGVPAAIDRYMATSDPELSGPFRQLLLVLEHGTTVFGFKFRRFTELSHAERTDYLTRWAGSSLGIQRQGFMGLKKLVNTFYYIEPASWQGIGYAGPWVK